MGWNIVAHSFSLLFRNFLDALRVTAMPVVVGLVLGWLVIRVTGLNIQMFVVSAMFGRLPPTGGILGLVGLAAIWGLGFAWVAVLWHRYVLLEEHPRLIVRFPAGRIAAYLGLTVLLFGIIVLVLVVVGLAFALLANVAGPVLEFLFGLWIVRTGASVVLIGSVTALFYRLGLALPAAAIGQGIGLVAAWRATRDLAGAIFSAGLIMAVLPAAVQLSLGQLGGTYWADTIIGTATGWVFTMAGVSILTTLYGVVIEGREIPSR